ncbi:hypothetical protein [Sphingopyxis sp. RIFCSPHIGHO2_12_FULL_65_19]|uniref:hypothetical protein n=1 Tax=Sphingopyxis sp. RIFCSPHIGHO2_12_FULL_65_19 TaxID=1802172 RepID=UPI0008ACE16A|nr:hypothetical protein [Sphingopyxis sp. RIFCSPHIGHO2_12_FULL_65_19]OHD07368.1 MAG: hypothetical protein A3E77_04590 [Sphingopyxis sp. RIFCSPHIGHO2_12_FULL_65_19]
MTGAAVPGADTPVPSASAPPGGMMLAPWLTPVRIALIVWAAMSLIAIIFNWSAIVALDLSDTDDAMRMVQVRDLLAGQSWWDLAQYRVNPAGGGVLMHWSRIVDAPLAAGVFLLEPLFGQAMAERVVMTLWPPLLGAALSVACVLGYRDLSDRRIALVVPLFLIMAGYIIVQFRPLRIDHHGWQILLAMIVIGQALRPATFRAGIYAGLAAAALIAVSIEGLPIAALFAGLAALRWVVGGHAEDRARLCGYMGALAGGALLFQFLTRGPAGLIGNWCDSLSAPYLAAFIAATALIFAAAAAHPARPWSRLAWIGAAGVAAAGALVWTEPQCAKGPFASLDPIVVQYWYRHVLEGQPVWASKPADAIHVLLPSLVGLAGSLLAWRSAANAADRRNWATVIVALAGAAALSLLVLRSAGTAHLFALPGCAWLGLRAWTRARSIASTLPRILASVAAALTLPLLGSMAAVAAFETIVPASKASDKGAGAVTPREATCLDRDAIAALDRLPPTTILTPIDLGPSILFWTHHSLVATPHHRNREAMADTIHIFIGDPAAAEALVRKQQARLIVYCPTANDFTGYRRARKDGLAAQLYAGTPPAWLEAVPIRARAGLSVWRVRPE